MMGVSGDTQETRGVTASRADERHERIAATLGEFGARIDMVERRVENELREIRDSMRRIEAATNARGPATPSQDLMLATQAVNRVADMLGKTPAAPAPPPQPPVHELVQAMAAAMRPASNTVGPISLLGYLTGIGSVVWVVRGLLGV